MLQIKGGVTAVSYRKGASVMKNRRKKIALFMAVIFFVCSMAGVKYRQNVYAYEEKDGTVTGDNVNVRKGAGTEYDKVTQLSKGHVVHIVGEATASNGVLWYQITFTKDDSEMEGYMSSAYISIVEGGTQDYEEKDGYVISDAVNVRQGAGTSYTSITKLDTGHAVHIIGEAAAANGAVWYHITFSKDGEQMEGYMHSDYIRIGTPPEVFSPSDTVDDADYETYLEQQGFPESYKSYLRTLHSTNPLWIFVALPTGIEWENAVEAESKLGRNLVPSSSITSYKSLEEGAIDWTTGTWIGFDTSSWVAASKQVIRYYLDPRNFLQGENTMLQFESLKYEEGVQTKEGVENILKGTYMEYGKTQIGGVNVDFAQIFMDAGKKYDISPYHLAARAKQETGVNGSDSSKETKSDSYAEFNGYYNFFNIGASPSADHNAMYNGLARAKAEGWTSPELSIMGGAQFIVEKYIARGQNTLYLQKFDVVDGGDGYYSHQYMTNLQAAASEAKLMGKTYSDFKQSAITYIVPVYLNMPDTPAACPTDNGSPYSVLSELSVEGYAFTQTFDSYTFDYTIDGEIDAQTLEIHASAYAPGVYIMGHGTVELQEGQTQIVITCSGSDGSNRVYTIHFTRTDVPKERQMGDVNGDYNVNAIDALLVLRASVQLETLSQEDFSYADVNQNGAADAGDALLILQYVTGEIDGF